MASLNEDENQPLISEVPVEVEEVRRIRYELYRRVVGVTAVGYLTLWIALAAARQIFLSEATYHPQGTCLDVVVITTVVALYALVAFVKNCQAVDHIGQYVVALQFVTAVSKLWMYRGWGDSNRAGDSAMVATSLLAGVLLFVSFHQRTAMMEAERVTLRWDSCKRILRPYFVPDGIRNKIFVVLTWTVLIAGKVCGIYSPIVLGQIVSNLTKSPPSDSRGLIALYCGLSLAPNILSEVQDSLYVKISQTAYAQVAEMTFRHVHSLSLEWHLKKKMGNVVRAMDRGMNGADNLMYYSMIYLFPAVGTAVASFIVFAIHFDQPEIAATCFMAFGLYCWVTFAVTVWRRKFREQMNQHDNDMHDKASDSLINFETVKCFTNEEHEVQHYISSVKAYQKGSFNTQASTSVLNVSQSATIQLAMFGSLVIAAYCAVHHEDGFDAGEFVAIQSYVMTIFQPLSYLGMIYNMIINSMVDIQNLSDLLCATADVVDDEDAEDLLAHVGFDDGACSLTAENVTRAATAKGVALEFRDVSFRYPSAGPKQGLKHISFTVPAGTTTAIVGPTGSGKTTISRLLFRFYDPLDGKVLMSGQDIRHCTQKSVRRLIGVVPQDTVMFNETIQYNIRYGRLSATDEEVEQAAKLAQVHDFVLRTEKGYDSPCGERGLKLSGGEKQRIAIARCLLKNPPVVLLDEATSALDTKTEREVQAALACLEGRTTVIIAHRLSTVIRAEQIIVLKDGEIAERGTHMQLLAKPGGIYAKMWNMQLSDQASDYII